MTEFFLILEKSIMKEKITVKPNSSHVAFLKNFPRSEKIRDAMKLLAKSLNGRKQHDDALKIYQNILEKFPKSHLRNSLPCGYSGSRSQQNVEAIAAYKKSIETFDRTQKIVPDYLREAHYKLANLLYQEGQYA